MTALSDVFNDKRREGELTALSQAATNIYKGSMVMVNTSGYALAAASTASNIFAGVAYETSDNSAGSAGAVSIRVWREGEFEFGFQGTAAQSDVGKQVWVVDDNTVSTAAKSTVAVKVLVGTIVAYVSTTAVRVRITTTIIS